MSAAANLRVEYQLDPYLSICVYDLVERCGVELRFLSIPSMEGIYSAGAPPIIAISSLRQSGRQRFTCAHELGHHVFRHGTRIDQFEGQEKVRRFDPQEFIVDCFADFLLMPKLAIVAAIKARGINLQTATPLQFFTLAGYFGVGYKTIVHHLWRNLGLIDQEDVLAADALVCFTEPPGDGGSGGRHVELGMALALGRRVIVVGRREHIFHHLPEVGARRKLAGGAAPAGPQPRPGRRALVSGTATTER